MRYAIVSDVHANIEALAATLRAADAEGFDRLVCLGDHVGYHADPNECIDLLRERGATSVAGNHDRAAVGIDEPTRFGTSGRRAILWTRRELSPRSRDHLIGLPLTRTIGDAFLAFHGALHPTPNTDVYLSTRARVRRSFDALVRGRWPVKIAFFGHTHRPIVHELRDGRVRPLPPARSVRLLPDAHYLINPGSVGQSRDGDPRASFVLFDARAMSVSFRRVDYDRQACRDKAARAGLFEPERPRRSPRALVAALVSAAWSALARRRS